VPTAPQITTTWLREQIAPALGEAGYQGSGHDFYRGLGRNWGVVNIQRSKVSRTEKVSFCVNLGVASALVLESCGYAPDARPPQWSERLGSLITGGHGLWWDICDDTNDQQLAALAAQILTALHEVGLPIIDAHASDEAILAAALKSDRPGTIVELDWTGVLVNALDVTTEQRRVFDAQIEKARKRFIRLDKDIRPAQGPKRVAANLALLADPRQNRRTEAAHLLGRAKPTTQVIDAVRGCLTDSDPEVRVAAARALADLGDVASLPQLLQMLEQEPNRIRVSQLGSSLGRLAERNDAVRPEVLQALRRRLQLAIGWDLVELWAAVTRLGAA
jgi:hypothetical protein